MATGETRYFKVAHNLLISYRRFSIKPLPFAIICDQENEFTADFDLVILIDNPRHSLVDKLLVPGLAPFDETIFIDADCLAYRDLNGLWRIFSHAGNFSCLGYTYPFHFTYGWIQREGSGVFRDDVQFSMVYQGGLFYMRKGRLEAFIRTCEYILDHYDSFTFMGYPFLGCYAGGPTDELIFALASSVHGYKPARGYEEVFCYYPLCQSVKEDIRYGKLTYRYKSTLTYPRGRYFLHWSMAEVNGDLYRRETERLSELCFSAKQLRGMEFKSRMKDIIPLMEARLRQLARTCTPLSFRIFLANLLKR